jgi:hypothetical protein
MVKVGQGRRWHGREGQGRAGKGREGQGRVGKGNTGKAGPMVQVLHILVHPEKV